MAGRKNIPVKKDQYSKNKPAAIKKEPVNSNNNKSKPGKRSYLNLVIALFISICGMVMYSNTSNHGYVLDDFSVVSQNTITKEGSKAITKIFHTGYREGNYTTQDKLYRPLTKAMFAIEYEQSGGKPGLLHVVNIISYGFLCGFIFLVLMKLMPQQFYIALIASLLFTFHPIHTEVVANIKSRDEIMVLWFILLSIWFAKSFADSGKMKWMIPSAIFYFLALFTKESAITFVALLPVTLYFFSKISLTKNGLITGVMAVATVIYLLIHQSVVGSIGLTSIPVADNSLLETKNFAIQRMTAIEILGRYLRLMIFPHPLTCDYSFSTIPLVKSAGNPGFLIALILHLGGLVYAIINFKRRSIAAYAILFYLITISVVSNIFILIGTNMAERLMFVPSLGFCLLVSYLLVKLLKIEKLKPENLGQVFTKKTIVWFILIPILTVAGIKTYSRNKDWTSISTLFNTDIKTVPNSIHMLYYHAGMISNSDSLAIQTPEKRLETLKLCEKELVRSVEIYPDFLDGHALLGKVYQRMGEFDKAIVHFKKFISLNDQNPVVYNNYGTCYGSKGDFENAKANFEKAIETSPICYSDALCNLGAVYIFYGEKYLKENNKEEATKSYNKSIELFNKTLECDANYANAYSYMGVSYYALGDTTKGASYTRKGTELKEQHTQQILQEKK